jgi:hypothetical protein
MEVSDPQHPGRLTPGERIPGTLWIGGRAGPRAGLVAVSRKINTSSCLDSNPGRPALSLVTELPELNTIKNKISSNSFMNRLGRTTYSNSKLRKTFINGQVSFDGDQTISRALKPSLDNTGK